MHLSMSQEPQPDGMNYQTEANKIPSYDDVSEGGSEPGLVSGTQQMPPQLQQIAHH